MWLYREELVQQLLFAVERTFYDVICHMYRIITLNVQLYYKIKQTRVGTCKIPKQRLTYCVMYSCKTMAPVTTDYCG